MKIEVKKLSEDEFRSKGVISWPIWTKEESTFDWYYDDREQCYFLEGKVTVKTDEGDITVGKGDFVVFPQGLKCVWEVHEPVKKHYKFG